MHWHKRDAVGAATYYMKSIYDCTPFNEKHLLEVWRASVDVELVDLLVRKEENHVTRPRFDLVPSSHAETTI
jgi:hypothetical protein